MNEKQSPKSIPPLVPCECGNKWARWWGDLHGHRQYMCSTCWTNQKRAAAHDFDEFGAK